MPENVEAFRTTHQKTLSWVTDTAELLGVREREAYRVLRATLHALRDCLPLNESAQLAAQMPMLLRGLYYEGWRPSVEPRLKARRRVTFLEAIRGHYGPGALDLEAGARAVFRVLGDRIAPGEVEDVQRSLPEAVRGLWPEVEGATRGSDAGHGAELGGTVGQAMTRGVLYSTPTRPLTSVLQRMEEERIRHLLVVHPDRLEPPGDRVGTEAIAGLVSERDVLRYLREHPEASVRLSDLVVRDVMTAAPLVTTEPGASLAGLARTMRQERLSAVPVLVEGRLVGLVTSDDLLRIGWPAAPEGRLRASA